jgi:hypothetical protein
MVETEMDPLRRPIFCKEKERFVNLFMTNIEKSQNLIYIVGTMS